MAFETGIKLIGTFTIRMTVAQTLYRAISADVSKIAFAN